MIIQLFIKENLFKNITIRYLRFDEFPPHTECQFEILRNVFCRIHITTGDEMIKLNI